MYVGLEIASIGASGCDLYVTLIATRGKMRVASTNKVIKALQVQYIAPINDCNQHIQVGRNCNPHISNFIAASCQLRVESGPWRYDIM